MYKLQRSLRLSQNFLRNRILVSKLVRNSSIGSNDLVLEIGPGEGIITRAFTGGRRLNQNLKPLISPEILNKLAHQLGFSVTAMPGEVTFDQWLELFKLTRAGSV